MYQKVIVYNGDSLNPYLNLARESTLYDTAEEGVLKVFLWQNDNTVVIGRNQNAYLDVNLAGLREMGGLLARRPTGGGAVYHDKGNLNFSFVTGRGGYDVTEDNEIILSAIKSLGFFAEVTGRNDMVIGGRKFSGHAYLKDNKSALHHGTILIKTDTDKMKRALNVNPDKLIGKGVASVKARVVNLTELDDKVTVQSVKDSIMSYLQNKYDDVQVCDIAEIDEKSVAEYQTKYSSERYLLGNKVSLASNRYKRFNWGYCDVHFTVDGGVISDIKIFSDGLDTDSIASAETVLKGADVTAELITENLIAKDVFSLLI